MLRWEAGFRCWGRFTVALLVGTAKTFFSENFVQYWIYFIGVLFVFVVMFLPDGLAGLLQRLKAMRAAARVPAPARRGKGGEMSELILSVEDLTVSFDGFKAVDGLNFYVDKDELRCVIGPNGAGKTTLLDMICGKTKPTRGTIKFKNHNLVDMIEYQITRIGVGRKFQTPSVYEDLTVFENLEISYPKKRGILGSLFFRRDQELLEKIDLVAGADFSWRGAAPQSRPAFATARSNGSRSACC